MWRTAVSASIFMMWYICYKNRSPAVNNKWRGQISTASTSAFFLIDHTQTHINNLPTRRRLRIDLLTIASIYYYHPNLRVTHTLWFVDRTAARHRWGWPQWRWLMLMIYEAPTFDAIMKRVLTSSSLAVSLRDPLYVDATAVCRHTYPRLPFIYTFTQSSLT